MIKLSSLLLSQIPLDICGCTHHNQSYFPSHSKLPTSQLAVCCNLSCVFKCSFLSKIKATWAVQPPAFVIARSFISVWCNQALTSQQPITFLDWQGVDRYPLESDWPPLANKGRSESVPAFLTSVPDFQVLTLSSGLHDDQSIHLKR